MRIEEARKKIGMKRTELASWLNIPYKTLSKWECNERPCPVYVQRLIVEKILNDGGNKMENKYLSFKAAVRESDRIIEENEVLIDSDNVEWDIFNLLDQEGIECDDNNYYCVGYDGAIGLTNNNGVNVRWLYTVKEKEQ